MRVQGLVLSWQVKGHPVTLFSSTVALGQNVFMLLILASDFWSELELEWSLTLQPKQSRLGHFGGDLHFTANHFTDTDKQNSTGKYTN